MCILLWQLIVEIYINVCVCVCVMCARVCVCDVRVYVCVFVRLLLGKKEER